MSGIKDTDRGMLDIRKELQQLGEYSIKAGITEGAGEKDGVSVAEYAAWNEYGVPGKKKLWHIPPRPFIRGWVENNGAEIATTMERIYGQVATGKMDAETAAKRLGQFAQDGIKRYIMTGDFTPNSAITISGSKPDKNGKQFIKGKGSSRPLIDTGTMRNSVRYEVIKK
jgi:hypothetical protein